MQFNRGETFWGDLLTYADSGCVIRVLGRKAPAREQDERNRVQEHENAWVPDECEGARGAIGNQGARTRMADVFISYSRKDTAFVRRLSDALEQRQREAWVDWEGIRPTEEFMLAIYAAIEGTNTFIFILTPDSVGSEVCAKEIAHAAKHNKRFIPIVHRDIDAKSVPETLAKLNWIFCREADDFAATVESLIDALDTDLDWVRAHTRLLTRAIEWESKGKNTSFVLRGDDLRAAEKWLTEAGADKERQPTPLQTDYIIASRKAAARRQRITLGAVSFGAVVAVVLAILALIQRGEARKQEGIAKDNAAEATRQKDVRARNAQPVGFRARHAADCRSAPCAGAGLSGARGPIERKPRRRDADRLAVDRARLAAPDRIAARRRGEDVLQSDGRACRRGPRRWQRGDSRERHGQAALAAHSPRGRRGRGLFQPGWRARRARRRQLERGRAERASPSRDSTVGNESRPRNRRTRAVRG